VSGKVTYDGLTIPLVAREAVQKQQQNYEHVDGVLSKVGRYI